MDQAGAYAMTRFDAVMRFSKLLEPKITIQGADSDVS
jgi:hypothetical protein